MIVNQRLPSRRRPLVKGRNAVYHVISRTVCDEFLFGDREKEVFRAMLWKQAAFHGVEILTYCVMSNHFHLLIRIPHHESLSDRELLDRYRARYAGENRPFSAPAPDVVEAAFARGEDDAKVFRKRLQIRMGNLPVFVRELKQAFCIWYNRRHSNHGTIWAERYKSLIVEDDEVALKVVAAYIDLNPVRARLVEDPGEYLWCGYAEALGGSDRAKNGLCTLFSGKSREWKHAIAAYRIVLFGKGRMVKGDPAKDRGRIPAPVADGVLAEKGELGISESLRHRVRYFTVGMALGSQEFLEGFFQNNREHFGQRRKAGARKMRGAEWGSLRVMRKTETEE